MVSFNPVTVAILREERKRLPLKPIVIRRAYTFKIHLHWWGGEGHRNHEKSFVGIVHADDEREARDTAMILDMIPAGHVDSERRYFTFSRVPYAIPAAVMEKIPVTREKRRGSSPERRVVGTDGARARTRLARVRRNCHVN